VQFAAAVDLADPHQRAVVEATGEGGDGVVGGRRGQRAGREEERGEGGMAQAHGARIAVGAIVGGA
jgi:hypothetical protein